jgi:hypothetical protein
MDFHAIPALPEFPESLISARADLPPDNGLIDQEDPTIAIHATCKGL